MTAILGLQLVPIVLAMGAHGNGQDSRKMRAGYQVVPLRCAHHRHLTCAKAVW